MLMVGRIVQYALSAQDVALINRQRFSSAVFRGQTFPLEVTRVWGHSNIVDGKVILGEDTLLITGADLGNIPGTWSWGYR